MMRSRFTQGALSALLVASCTAAMAVASTDDSARSRQPPPRFDPLLAPFLKTPTLLGMTLSPDGRHLAAVGFGPTGANTGVIMMDTETLQAELILAPKVWKTHDYRPYVRNPQAISWLDDARIAVNFSVADAAVFRIDGTPGIDLMQGYVGQLLDAAGKPTDWSLVIRDRARLELSRMNTVSGANESYDLDIKGKVSAWLADAFGDIRVAWTVDTAFFSDTTRVQTWYRPEVGGDWRIIDERSVLDDAFRPVAVGPRPGHLMVMSRNGGDRQAVWDYDVGKHAFGELMAGHASEDVTVVDGDPLSGDLEEIVTDGLQRHTFWFDQRFASLQAGVDASLPGKTNVLHRTRSDNVLVFSSSDVDPGRWYVLESTTMKMREVVERMPSIDPKRMQPVQALHYPSFDGLQIPAYLTLPGKPTGPAPMVVLIHGGPQARDRWAFDSEVQILAAHGYAVFQPQFRGSTGFGKHFEEAGYGQWGRAMQDDITAGVHWLIDQKIADPGRICIVGGSYGGYAALWGLEKTPDLYKCGVSVAGVSDLESMLHDDSDMSRNAIAREVVRHQLGDLSKMQASFEEVSPLRHADRVQAPVLLVHGDRDRRVPISHGTRMRDALLAAHKDVQWIAFPNEAHGIVIPSDLREYYAALFALFERTIGKGEPPAPAPAGAVRPTIAVPVVPTPASAPTTATNLGAVADTIGR